MDGGVSVERDAGIGYGFRMFVLALARLESIDCVLAALKSTGYGSYRPRNEWKTAQHYENT